MRIPLDFSNDLDRITVIIGLDFLKELKATLFVDPNRKIGYIDVPG
ncbi:MAG: hypothetical protein KGH54_03540 [Candidatus Micrarchaeota archaeon]|nr:hypothetical protein [Candidatus Micrarchaeota archaeon]